MKKLLCIAAFAGMISIGYCQDVKVNINNQEATAKEDCPYRINGICSTEDIGGVDVQFLFGKEEKCTWGCNYAIFTNYNTFPVTVLYEIEWRIGSSVKSKTGSIVLGVDGSKRIELEDYGDDLSPRSSVKGIIVRKLQN